MCNSCWSNPTTKDAYRLSITSLVIEVLATWGGIAFFSVRWTFGLIMLRTNRLLVESSLTCATHLLSLPDSIRFIHLC